MEEKYRATIHGNTIEWDGEVPEVLANDASIRVDVTVVSPKPKLRKPDGKKMAAALEALSRLTDQGGIKSIKDPVEWQRAIRKDRPLPGR